MLHTKKAMRKVNVYALIDRKIVLRVQGTQETVKFGGALAGFIYHKKVFCQDCDPDKSI